MKSFIEIRDCDVLASSESMADTKLRVATFNLC